MFSSVYQCTISIFVVIHLINGVIGFCNSFDSRIYGFPNNACSFKDLLLSGKFVDKSLLISEILKHDEKVFQITRPIKWGKTVNLEMLKMFFDIETDERGDRISDKEKINPSLFKGGEIRTTDGNKPLRALNIAGRKDAMTNMGKHPVIALNLKEVKGNSIAEIERRIRHLVVELFGKYPFIRSYLGNGSCILDDDEKDRLRNFMTGNLDGEYLFDFLQFLSMILYEHYHSYVCLFIDDYDLPLINAYLSFGGRGKEFEYVVEMFRRIYDYTFKENQYLFKAVITGTLNLEIVSSGKSEFEYKYILYNSVWDKEFFRCYGLFEEELDIIKQSTVFNNSDEIQRWYGGFLINQTEVYNLGSVLHLVLEKDEEEYYLLNNINTDIMNFLYEIVMSELPEEDLHLIAAGKEIIRNQFSKTFRLRNLGNDMFSLLAHVGFLTIKPPQRVTEQPVWRMEIANLEIRGVLAAVFKAIAAKELNIGLAEYNNFTNLLFAKEVDKFGRRFAELLLGLEMLNTTKKDERIYHNLMSNIAASLGVGYLVDSIKEFGMNRGEHLIIPFAGYGNCAFNIEYVICTPWQPLEQFVRASLENMLHRPRHCTSKMRICQHVSEILYISLGFCGHRVMIKHKITSIT